MAISKDELQAILLQLIEEHRTLDEAITALGAETAGFDQIKLQRLKKRKLGLKDQISQLRAMVVPDIIA